jgi:hypothetical protein
LNHLPPPKEPPLREEPELLDRPKPPKPPEREEELGLEARELDVLPNERCDWVGLARTLALAATLSALGEVAGLLMTGWDEVLTVEPAVRDLMEPV